jgi:hypothetical protein
VLYLNRSVGMDVSLEQFWKVEEKPEVETAVLYLNKSVGMDVRLEQPEKVPVKP